MQKKGCQKGRDKEGGNRTKTKVQNPPKNKEEENNGVSNLVVQEEVEKP